MDYTQPIRLNANNKKIIYAKITDIAQNDTIINSDGIVVYTDSQLSTTSIAYTEKSTEDVTAKVILNGNTVKTIWDGKKELTAGIDYTVDASGTITFKNSYLSTLAVSGTPYTLIISYNPMGETYVSGENHEPPAQTSLSLTVNAAPAPTIIPTETVPVTPKSDVPAIKVETMAELVKPIKSYKTSQKISWSKVKGANGYYIYSAKCSTKANKNKQKKIKSISSGEKTSVVVKGLKKATWYKSHKPFTFSADNTYKDIIELYLKWISKSHQGGPFMNRVEGNYTSLYYHSTVRKNQKENVKKSREPEKADTTDKTKQPQLSKAAQNLLEKLRKKYRNMDFMVADFDSTEEARAALSRGTKEVSVLFSSEELEKMAADEKCETEYMNRVQGALQMSDEINKTFGYESAFGKKLENGEIAKIGVVFNQDGTTTYFAELEKSTNQQKERIEEAREKRAEEKKATDKKEKANRDNVHTKKVTIQASSKEELIEKINEIDWSKVKEEITLEGDKFDYSI